MSKYNLACIKALNPYSKTFCLMYLPICCACLLIKVEVIAQSGNSSLPPPKFEVSSESALKLMKQGSEEFKKGNLDRADELFKDASVADPWIGDAYFNRGVIAEQKNDLKAALENYRRAALVDPKDKEAEKAIKSVSERLPEDVLKAANLASPPAPLASGNKSSNNNAQKRRHHKQLANRLLRTGIRQAIRLSIRGW